MSFVCSVYAIVAGLTLAMSCTEIAFSGRSYWWRYLMAAFTDALWLPVVLWLLGVVWVQGGCDRYNN